MWLNKGISVVAENLTTTLYLLWGDISSDWLQPDYVD